MPFTRKRHLGSRELQGLRRQRLALAGLVIAALLALAFYLGERAAYSGMGLSPELYRAMKTQVPRLQSEVAALTHELEVVRTRNQVSEQALELVRREIAEQKEEISGLEEGLQFYRSLMAPGEIAQGLSLRPLELVATDQPDRYSFRIVAQQEASKHALLKGELSAELLGVRDEQQLSYSLAELSDDLEGPAITLRFRYFQSIEGTLVLPQGFQPGSVRLVATASSPRRMEVREEFPWQVNERFTHVGK
ncbi:hypothetical protein DWB85_13640 [Seongchinamella sediminis]|uniref:Uncharacterized protein n=1 Tax=Seongchinamella sediminis TaxID=2283635 RepID=A0A3L7DVI2_9GAMM|nr:DUF6776 family protein [Seongchinamella sediminis]RLQ21126.1 hypothetical protein DWB85_13640 [Seongchinamella sediminis]